MAEKFSSSSTEQRPASRNTRRAARCSQSVFAVWRNDGGRTASSALLWHLQGLASEAKSCGLGMCQRRATDVRDGWHGDALQPTASADVVSNREKAYETLGGHQSIVFHLTGTRNNTRTLPISKRCRTTSCAAETKEMSLLVGIFIWRGLVRPR